MKLPYTMPIKDKMNTVDAYENLIYDALMENKQTLRIGKN